MRVENFPPLNAILNSASASLLLAGFIFIKTGRFRAHAVMMICAFITSSVFLVSYITYHTLRVRQGITITRFPASGLRPVYLGILGSHTFLAVAILPLILLTFWRASSRRWNLHRRIAVVTLPLWFYVSVTGVIIYWMLYDIAPRLAR